MNLPRPKECTVSGTLSIVLRMSKIFGLAPLKFKRVRDGWRIRVSPAASLYGRTVSCLIFVMTIIALILEFNEGDHRKSNHFKTNSDTAAVIISVIIILLSLLTTAFLGFSRMQCVISSLAQLQKINTELSEHGSPPPCKTSILLLSICSIVGVLLVLITQYSVTLYFMILRKYGVLAHLLYISFFLAMFMNKIILLQTSTIIMTVTSSLHHLNNCLRNLLQKLRNESTNIKPFETAATVNNLRTLYDSLCGVIKQIDNSYGVILVILIPLFLASLVITFYNLITGLFKGEINLYVGIIQSSWALVHILHMIMTIEPCHLTYEQIDITKRLVGQLLLLTSPVHHDVIHVLELFCKHLMNDVVYTPMGIFYLNRTIVVTIVGSITTYLVVMV